MERSGSEERQPLPSFFLFVCFLTGLLCVGLTQENQLPLDIVGILQSSVDQHGRMAASPYLLGRCLWTASRFATVLPEPLLQRYLQATVRRRSYRVSRCLYRVVHELCPCFPIGLTFWLSRDLFTEFRGVLPSFTASCRMLSDFNLVS